MPGSTVRKDELLGILKENRQKHQQVFLDALEGYRQAAMAALAEEIERLRVARALRTLQIMMPAPENHTHDYDRIIRMVEMEVKDTVKLDEHDFAHYVLDDWAWKQRWLDTANTYAAASVATTYGKPDG
jgi:hypothetical protein